MTSKAHKKMRENDSIPGKFYSCAGGVGRNISEAIKRSGFDPIFISIVGDDFAGDFLISDCENIGLNTDRIVKLKGSSTGIYNSILNSDGEMFAAVASMEIETKFTSEFVLGNLQSDFRGKALFQQLHLTVFDGNLPEETIIDCVHFCHKNNLKGFFFFFFVYFLSKKNFFLKFGSSQLPPQKV